MALPKRFPVVQLDFHLGVAFDQRLDFLRGGPTVIQHNIFHVVLQRHRQVIVLPVLFRNKVQQFVDAVQVHFNFPGDCLKVSKAIKISQQCLGLNNQGAAKAASLVIFVAINKVFPKLKEQRIVSFDRREIFHEAPPACQGAAGQRTHRVHKITLLLRGLGSGVCFHRSNHDLHMLLPFLLCSPALLQRCVRASRVDATRKPRCQPAEAFKNYPAIKRCFAVQNARQLLLIAPVPEEPVPVVRFDCTQVRFVQRRVYPKEDGHCQEIGTRVQQLVQHKPVLNLHRNLLRVRCVTFN